MDLYDPTFRGLQDDNLRPRSTGTVLQDLGSYQYAIAFAGRQIVATAAGKNQLTVGDTVTVVETSGKWWAIDATKEYPSRWGRPLSDFANSNPAGTFLRYVLDGNPRAYTYQVGSALGTAGEHRLTVMGWDGVTRTLDVRYGDDDAPAALFVPGDEVLMFQPPVGRNSEPSGVWEVVGGQALAWFETYDPGSGPDYLDLALTVTAPPATSTAIVISGTATQAWGGTVTDAAGVRIVSGTGGPFAVNLTITNSYPTAYLSGLVGDAGETTTVTISSVAGHAIDSTRDRAVWVANAPTGSGWSLTID